MEPRPAIPELAIFGVVLVGSKHRNSACFKIPGVIIVGSVRFVHVVMWGLLSSYFGGQFFIFFTSLASGGAMCGIVAIVLWR